MNKVSKIIRAKKILEDHMKTIEEDLSKVLTAKERKELEPELKLLRQSFKMVLAKTLQLDKPFTKKVRKYTESDAMLL